MAQLDSQNFLISSAQQEQSQNSPHRVLCIMKNYRFLIALSGPCQEWLHLTGLLAGLISKYSPISHIKAAPHMFKLVGGASFHQLHALLKKNSQDGLGNWDHCLPYFATQREDAESTMISNINRKIFLHISLWLLKFKINHKNILVVCTWVYMTSNTKIVWEHTWQI